jgi:hypothetical protein
MIRLLVPPLRAVSRPYPARTACASASEASRLRPPGRDRGPRRGLHAVLLVLLLGHIAHLQAAHGRSQSAPTALGIEAGLAASRPPLRSEDEGASMDWHPPRRMIRPRQARHLAQAAAGDFASGAAPSASYFTRRCSSTTTNPPTGASTPTRSWPPACGTWRSSRCPQVVGADRMRSNRGAGNAGGAGAGGRPRLGSTLTAVGACQERSAGGQVGSAVRYLAHGPRGR